ncbi:hypothetical protein [Deinococcus ruber]|uniref:DUF3996 domain-containing protein n=1 Tax=Deinococcus ruber TaxID=1848197 RepID=A0A918CA66_9DEIO|nr:hypothetical protein [Deinococcus ruber]GGR14738.1 hypothetical protein GCM10008957_29460 [Deinococcus ruber]
MRTPAILLSLSLAASALATTASASADAPSSFNLRSGMASVLVSLDYEQAISANESLEVGANVFGNTLGVNVGVKHFFSPAQRDFFVHGQGAYLFGSNSVGSNVGLLGISGGYRFVGNSPLQFDLEAGIDVLLTPGSSIPVLAVPAVGLSVGYRF